MSNSDGKKKYTRIILLNNISTEFSLVKVVNPFSKELVFNIETSSDRKVDVTLLDMYGKKIKKHSFIAYSGANSLAIQTPELPSGMYILEVRDKEKVLTQKIIKR